jgi:heme/copper-type cytochrome/quinol oxidase subunit 2
LYCRSWSMSRAAAYILAEKWYTNVYDLVWWKIWYDLYKNNKLNDVSQATVITLDAKRWEYSQKEIRVKKWEKLIIKINNTDRLHGIAIPDMKLTWNEQIEVDTSEAWEFEFRCANYCWWGHQEMVWRIIIE